MIKEFYNGTYNIDYDDNNIIVDGIKCPVEFSSGYAFKCEKRKPKIKTGYLGKSGGGAAQGLFEQIAKADKTDIINIVCKYVKYGYEATVRG